MDKVRASAAEAVADIPDGAARRPPREVFRKSAANFNALAAMAGRLTVAAVELPPVPLEPRGRTR